MGDEPETPDETTRAPEGGASPPTPAPAPKPPVEDWESRFKYLFADFENFRRRAERERESITRQSRAALLRELLPLVEAFRSAHDAARQLPPSDPLRQGLELLDREWTKFLRHQGLEPVAVPGEPFRAEEEEAVGETAPNDGAPDGAVAEIVQQGYRFFGGLLRPAKVIVARARPSPEAMAEKAESDPHETGGASS